MKRIKFIKHTRVLDLRQKIAKGWTMEQLHQYCITNLQVTKQTANNYIDEAAEPFRKKFAEEKLEEKN